MLITEKAKVSTNILNMMSELSYSFNNLFVEPLLPESHQSRFENKDQDEETFFITPDVPDTTNFSYSCFELNWGGLISDDLFCSRKNLVKLELFDSSKDFTDYERNTSFEGNDLSFNKANISGSSFALLDLTNDSDCELMNLNFLSSSLMKEKQITNFESEHDILNVSHISSNSILNNVDSFIAATEKVPKKINKTKRLLDFSDSLCGLMQDTNTVYKANGKRFKKRKRKFCGENSTSNKESWHSDDSELGKNIGKLAKLSVTNFPTEITNVAINRKLDITARVTQEKCKLSTQNVKANNEASSNLSIKGRVSSKTSSKENRTTVSSALINSNKKKLNVRTCSNSRSHVISEFDTIFPTFRKNRTTRSIIKWLLHNENDQNLSSLKVSNTSSKLFAKSELFVKEQINFQNNNVCKSNSLDVTKGKIMKDNNFNNSYEKIFGMGKPIITIDNKFHSLSPTQTKSSKISTRSLKQEKLDNVKRNDSNLLCQAKKTHNFKRKCDETKVQYNSQPVLKRKANGFVEVEKCSSALTFLEDTEDQLS